MSNATAVNATSPINPGNVTYAPPAFPALEPFFAGNHAFSSERNATNANYFPKMAEGQAPPLVWIGCADSRVPESVVLHQDPGQVFTTVSRDEVEQEQEEQVGAWELGLQ